MVVDAAMMWPSPEGVVGALTWGAPPTCATIGAWLAGGGLLAAGVSAFFLEAFEAVVLVSAGLAGAAAAGAE